MGFMRLSENKKTLAAIFVILLAAGFLYLWQSKQRKEAWLKYENPKLGFNFEYPNRLFVAEGGSTEPNFVGFYAKNPDTDGGTQSIQIMVNATDEYDLKEYLRSSLPGVPAAQFEDTTIAGLPAVIRKNMIRINRNESSIVFLNNGFAYVIHANLPLADLDCFRKSFSILSTPDYIRELSENDLFSSATTTNFSASPDMELGSPGTRLVLPPGDFFEVPTAGGVVFIVKNNKLHAEYIYKQETIKNTAPFQTPYLVSGGVMYSGQNGRVTKNYVTDVAVVSGIADPSSFEFVTEDPFYMKDSQKVYFLPWALNPTPILHQKSFSVMQTEADSKTFRIISKDSHLGADNSDVYMNGKKLPDMDLNTLHNIFPNENYFYKDKNAIYTFGSKFLGGSVNSYEGAVKRIEFSDIVLNDKYSFDSQHVYYEGKIMPEADPDSFMILWHPVREGCGFGAYARDAKHVYFESRIVQGADPDTFESLINGYGMDKNGIWLRDEFQPDLPTDFSPECDYG